MQLFDSPVSGMVLATHQGTQQECNRPDQLQQCRDHCYSDLGFLLPVKASPPSRQRVAVVTGMPGGADLRMWIGYDDVDRLISYPDAHNLSGCA